MTLNSLTLQDLRRKVVKSKAVNGLFAKDSGLLLAQIFFGGKQPKPVETLQDYMMRFVSTDQNRPALHTINVRGNWVYATDGRRVAAIPRDKEKYPKDGVINNLTVDSSEKVNCVDEIIPTDLSEYEKFRPSDVIIDSISMGGRNTAPTVSLNESAKSHYGYNLNLVLDAVQSFDYMSVDWVCLPKNPLEPKGLFLECTSCGNKLKVVIMPLRVG